MIDSAGNTIATTVIDRNGISLFIGSLQGLAHEEYAADELARLTGDRIGIGESLAVIAVGVNPDDHTPVLKCAIPVEFSPRGAELGAYFPSSTNFSIARLTVRRALDCLKDKPLSFGAFARVTEETQAAYKVNYFSPSNAPDRLYICSNRLRLRAD